MFMPMKFTSWVFCVVVCGVSFFTTTAPLLTAAEVTPEATGLAPPRATGDATEGIIDRRWVLP